MFVCLLFLTTFSTYANAQEIPVAEYSGGYSYSSVKPDFLSERGNAHGFRADIVLNTRLFGIVLADVSKHCDYSASSSKAASLGTPALSGPRSA
jgi:hypothetical protein